MARLVELVHSPGTSGCTYSSSVEVAAAPNPAIEAADAAAAAAAAATGEHPALRPTLQLVLAVSIVAHIAADAHCRLSDGGAAAEQLASVLLDCRNEESPVLQAPELLFQAVMPLQFSFKTVWSRQPAEFRQQPTDALKG